MGKENLLVIIGAGGGIDVGLPSTEKITDGICDLNEPMVGVSPYYYSIVDKNLEIPIGMENYPVIPYVWNIIKQYYNAPNFEHLVHTFEMLSTLYKNKFIGSSISDSNKVTWIPFTSIPYNTYPLLSHAAKIALFNILSDIAKMINDVCSQENIIDTNKWYKDFWQKIGRNSNLKIVNINYDNLINKAIPNAKTGYDDEFKEGLFKFDPSKFWESLHQENITLNLHGSINFGYYPSNYRGEELKEPKEFYKTQSWEDLYYFEKPEEAFNTWENGGRSHNVNLAGEDCIIGPIITGLHKADKLLAIPYMYYFSSLLPLIYQCQKVIIIGYSFSDIHLNQWLIRISHLHKNNRRIIIVTKDQNNYERNCSKFKDYYYSLLLIKSRDTLIDLGQKFENMYDLTNEDRMPKSDDGCLAIWFDGFKSFAENGLEEGLEFLGL